jgi:ubiquinone biosynthesis protein UbiJ
VIAHKAGNLVRGLASWARESGESVRRGARDYLQEEGRMLPTRLEVEYFARAVETLRMDADRLQARLKQLRRKLEE